MAISKESCDAIKEKIEKLKSIRADISLQSGVKEAEWKEFKRQLDEVDGQINKLKGDIGA